MGGRVLLLLPVTERDKDTLWCSWSLSTEYVGFEQTAEAPFVFAFELTNCLDLLTSKKVK